jgi:hypothetical protein
MQINERCVKLNKYLGKLRVKRVLKSALVLRTKYQSIIKQQFNYIVNSMSSASVLLITLVNWIPGFFDRRDKPLHNYARPFKFLLLNIA